MMSQQEYNQFLSNLLKEKQALASLRAKLEGKREREYWQYRKFGYLAYNYRKEKKGKKVIPQNKFEMLLSKVMKSGKEERYIRQ